MLPRFWVWIRNDTTSTDWLIVILTAVIAATSYLQWREINSGSSDTHALAEASKRQAEKAETISASIGQAVTNLKTSADEAGRQAKAAQQSVAAIQRQTFQTERPWISIEVAPAIDDFSFDDKQGAILDVAVTLRNTGHSVANYVSVWTALEPDMDWPAAQKRICSIPKSPQNAKSDYGYLMFPGQTTTDNIPATASVANIARSSKKYAIPGMPGVVGFNLVVCADYKSVLESGHHQTRRALMMGWTNRANNTAMGAFEPSRHYNGLGFVPILHGDSAD
ncbi:MAG TPA: hypothetical protein VGZ91_16565 [Candidatus Sulfotelmatobacter sp.]|jgi:ElaB/YqjD/DUF883 family membrane-anchored ribosome-binding protein|nr:hypothetical protein [Candidatus Sulfotelmatobacter sp.]